MRAIGVLDGGCSPTAESNLPRDALRGVGPAFVGIGAVGNFGGAGGLSPTKGGDRSL